MGYGKSFSKKITQFRVTNRKKILARDSLIIKDIKRNISVNLTKLFNGHFIKINNLRVICGNISPF
jgi:hypothetical protein